MTKLLDGNVSAQSLFQINLSLTDNKAETGSELAGLISWNYAWHYVNIAGSGMVIYRFHIGNYPLIARYQANVPLMGLMFSPEYGQSYYEIFNLKHGGKNILFTSLHNQPALRQLLTLDFPIGNMNVRAGYICDI